MSDSVKVDGSSENEVEELEDNAGTVSESTSNQEEETTEPFDSPEIESEVSDEESEATVLQKSSSEDTEAIELTEAVVESEPLKSIFSDVDVTHPEYPYLVELKNRGIIMGYPDGTFRPDKTLTRGQMAKIIALSFELKGTHKAIFTDVTKSNQYNPTIYSLLANKVTNGYPDRTFKPNQTIHRRHFLLFVARSINPAFRVDLLELPPKVEPPKVEPPKVETPKTCAKPSSKKQVKIAVQAANFWKKPAMARSVDYLSIKNPTNMQAWSKNLTTNQSWWLVQQTDTQALYGDDVTILEQRGNWVRVSATNQWVPYQKQGYPGWVPVNQITTSTKNYTDCRIAVVHASKSILRDVKTNTPQLEVSYSTILPVIGEEARFWIVASPNDKELRVRKTEVVVHKNYASIPKPSADKVVAEAKRFLGLRYIWSGTSSYGFDCSGILYAIMRTHGVLIPRDSFYQATKGTFVSQKNLRKGDFVFYGSGGGTGKVYHVGLYIGGGMMLHAPNASSVVKIERYNNGIYGYNYHSARRYIQ